MTQQEKNNVQAVRHIMATLYSAQNALRSLSPEFRWAGMGNLLGDYGEFLAIHHDGFEKNPAGTSGSDCVTPDGQTVQVKTNHAASSIGYRGEADKMLVLKVHDDGSWEELCARAPQLGARLHQCARVSFHFFECLINIGCGRLLLPTHLLLF